MAKLKTKDAQELFILLQQAFFKHPENNSSFESAKGADGAAAVTMTVAANFDVSKVSSSLKKRLAGIIPENSERTTLCTVVLKAAREGEGIKVKTADTKFTLEPRFNVFTPTDTKIIEVLAERMIDWKKVHEAAAKALEADAHAPFTVVPAEVLDLRVLVNSPNLRLGDIDVSGLDDLTYCFAIYDNNKVSENQRTDFSGIEKWDTSNVKKMLGVFAGCVNFNKDISMWDTSKAETMDVMFASCKKFNQDLSKWDVSKVESMKGMFYRAESFDQDLSAWDTSAVIDMSYTFFKAKAYSHDLSSWNTGSVKNDENMFLECPLDSHLHPRLPSEDFKMKYYEKYVAGNGRGRRKMDIKQKLLIALAFLAMLVVFGIMGQTPPQG